MTVQNFHLLHDQLLHVHAGRACRVQSTQKEFAYSSRESLVVTRAPMYRRLNIVMPSSGTLFVYCHLQDKCGMTANLTSDQLTIQS